VHSRYTRTLADLPWRGVRVRLLATVRRFFCDAAACRRRIFAEPLPTTATRYARRTCRAAATLDVIGFALGGRAGARLAAALGLSGGPAAILGCVRAHERPARATPRVLGVDDWAWRRGQTYGRILVDLEVQRVVDLLPDRTAATLAAWLTAHPGVEIISRDRGGEYAEGARLGAPDAIQVADRFHLLRNLVDAVERAVVRHAHELHSSEPTGEVLPAAATARRVELRALTRRRPYSATPTDPPGPTAKERESAERRARRLARYEQVVALGRAGLPATAIADAVGLDRRTVRRWLRAGRSPERERLSRPRRRPLDAFAAFIAQRHDAGLENATALCAELRDLGYGGSVGAVRAHLADRRVARLPAALEREGTTPGDVASGVTALRHPASAAPLPSARKVAWLLWRADAELSTEDAALVATLCDRSPAVAACRALALEFRRLLRERDPGALRPWLAAAERSPLRGLAAGVRRDFDAVLAAACFRWSNGQVEGQVHRLKLVKRSMYGRASFDLLRRRVLGAA
jgi:transposase